MIRKIIICIIMLALVYGSYFLVAEGVSYGSIDTVTLDDLKQKNSNLNSSIQSLEDKNNSQYMAKKTALESAVKNYTDKKEEYEALIPQMESELEEDASTSAVDLYDIDFLWTIIGNYATEEGVVLRFDVTRSVSNVSAAISSLSTDEYVFCDLNFTVSGEYIAITDYIYHLEDDDRLNFEISSFKLEKGGENLQATFVVKAIPINNKNLSLVSSSNLNTGSVNTGTVNDYTVDGAVSNGQPVDSMFDLQTTPRTD